MLSRIRIFFLLRSFKFAVEPNGGSTNGGCNGVDGVIVVVKSMAIDDHLLLWVDDIRQKTELSKQTMLTTSTLYRRRRWHDRLKTSTIQDKTRANDWWDNTIAYNSVVSKWKETSDCLNLT